MALVVCFEVFFFLVFFLSELASEVSLSLFLSSTKKEKKTPLSLFFYLDGVVRSLGQVVPEPRHRARKVERRRRRVDGGADGADGRERVVCRVLQSRGGNVAVHEGVGRCVDDGLGALERAVPRGLEDDALVDVPRRGRVDEVGGEDLGGGDDDLGRGGRGGELVVI